MNGCCLVFEKKNNISLQTINDVDNVFIACFENQTIAEKWIKERYPELIDEVIYKTCIIH